MKYFKNQTGEVFAFEQDGSQDHLITPDMAEMSQAEIEAHINPPLTQQQLDEIAFAEFKAQKLAEQEALLRQEYEATKL